MIQLDNLEFVSAHSAHAVFEMDSGLTLRIEAHAPGVFRLRCGPASKRDDEKLNARARARQELLLARPEAIGEMSTESLIQESGWRFVQGDITLQMHARPFRLALFRNEQLLLSTDSQFVSPFVAEVRNDQPESWGLMLGLPDNTPVYGLGETTGDFNRRGQEVVSDLPGFNYLPLAWSPQGWGLYVNTLGRVLHAPGIPDEPDTYQLFVEDGVFDLFLFASEPAEIFNQYSALTGRAGQPPLWAMGAWLAQQKGQDINEISNLAKAMREQGLPLDVLRLGNPSLIQFQQDKQALEWDVSRLDDARRYFAQLAEDQWYASVTTFPGVLSNTPLFADLEDRGWLLCNEEGLAQVFDGVPATDGQPFGLLDLTYKDAFLFWQERHAQLIEEGASAIECKLPVELPDSVSARNGESGPLLRTLYPLLLKKALFEAVSRNKIPAEGVVLNDSLGLGSQRTPWKQLECPGNDWDAMSQVLRSALSVQASGIVTQVHDIGNPQRLSGPVDPEWYLRYLGLSVFSAGFALHANPALLPTAFDEKTQSQINTLLELRYRLIPYVLGIIEDSVRTGLPVQRMMALAFPNDARALEFDTQFMFGPALLVAPILEPGGQVVVYLPEGEAWWDLNTGWRYEGGQSISLSCALDSVPVFGREGHMLCLGPVLKHLGEFNTARILDEVWMFGMPLHNPVVMRNKIRVMQMQGSSYIKGLEGLRILQSEGLEVKRRGAEVRISRER